jgi:hypothetical protein
MLFTPLSLLISCKVSFPIVGLEMSSLPSSGKESLGYYELKKHRPWFNEG